MSDLLLLLSPEQRRRIEPFFPRSRGLRRVDDRRVVSGIVYVNPPRPAVEGRASGLRAT